MVLASALRLGSALAAKFADVRTIAPVLATASALMASVNVRRASGARIVL